MRDIAYLGARLLIFTLIAGVLLGGTFALTKGPIAAQEEQQLVSSQRALFPAADAFADIPADHPGVNAVYEAKSFGGALLGWVISVTSMGYKGAITQSVGIARNGCISGSSVTAQHETAGLGSKATEPTFLKQFTGQAADADTLKLDAITGATISSKAVFAGIKSAAEYAKGNLDFHPSALSATLYSGAGVLINFDERGVINGVVNAETGEALDGFVGLTYADIDKIDATAPSADAVIAALKYYSKHKGDA